MIWFTYVYGSDDAGGPTGRWYFGVLELPLTDNATPPFRDDGLDSDQQPTTGVCINETNLRRWGRVGPVS
jgi:hypothetical protein